MLSVNKYTCSDMIYEELGVTPLSIAVSIRMVVYWAKLVSSNQNKISNMIYSIVYKLHDLEIFKSDWINTVRSILNESGFSGIWLSQTMPFSVDCLRHNLKIRLRDQIIQKWQEGISQSRKCTNYRIFKNIFGFDNYLIELPEELRKYLTKFRCRNHRLPIEIGCHENVLRDMRICQHCRKDIGDNYHYLLCCPQFSHQ